MVNIEQTNGMLKISSVNKQGNIELRNLTIPEDELFEWKLTKHSNEKFKTWNDKPVKKIPSQKLNKYRIIEYLQKIPKHIQDEIFSFNMPKRYYIDIETDSSEEFWKPTNPQGAIQTIAIASEKGNVLLMGIKQLSKENIENIEKKLNRYFKQFNINIKFKYAFFKSEYDMLYTFFAQVIKPYPLICGWNFIDFDWTYLVERAKLLEIDAGMSSMSGRLTGKNQTPLHKMVVDYMEIYKKWDRIVDVKESNSLDWVSKEVLGLTKIKYKGSLADLYRNNYEDFLFYNATDSLLVKFLDDKLNTLAPFLKLSYLAKVEYHKAFSPVFMTENLMIQEYLKENKILVEGYNPFGSEKEYEGAYVMEPIKGYHKWTMTCDFNSMYPTNMREWDMSPEKFVGIDKNFDVSKNKDFVKAANGAIFKRGNKDGVIKIILTRLFKQRKDAQKVAKVIEEEIYELKKYLNNNHI